MRLSYHFLQSKVTSMEWIRWDKKYADLLFPEIEEEEEEGEEDLPQITWNIGKNNIAQGLCLFVVTARLCVALRSLRVFVVNGLCTLLVFL